MARKQWADLSQGQRAGVVVLSATEIVLTATAAFDLYRRPGGRMRGPKAFWWLAIFVQPIGPIAYLLWARRGGDGASAVTPAGATVEGPA